MRPFHFFDHSVLTYHAVCGMIHNRHIPTQIREAGTMNDARRKLIAKALTALSGALSDVETVRDEEQETYDNMPENLQNSEKGEAVSSNVDSLESAHDSIEQAIDSLDSIG